MDCVGKANITEALLKTFEEIKHDKKTIMEVDNVLNNEHGFIPGTTNEAILSPQILESWSSEELIVLTQALYEITKSEEIAPKKFFSNKEIKGAQDYKKVYEEELIYPFTLTGVLKGSDILYSTFISYSELKRLWENGAITYNMKIQRLPKEKKNKDGSVSLKPDIKPKSVKSIADLMVRRKYKSNSLILNILVDGNDNIEYEDGELIVGEGTVVNIIDGAHRLEGAISALEADPDSDDVLPVVIYHLPLEEAQDCLSQVNTFNAFDKTLVKFYGNKKISDQIVKDLMSIPELINRVRIKTTITKKSEYLTNFAVLTESIDEVFQPETTKDRYDVANALKKFFGYLISAYEDEFVKDLINHREHSWMTHHNTFAGYVVLCKKLVDKYGADYDTKHITDMIDKIDFRKQEGLEYNDIIAPQGKVNSNKIKKDIRDFFEKLEV